MNLETTLHQGHIHVALNELRPLAVCHIMKNETSNVELEAVFVGHYCPEAPETR